MSFPLFRVVYPPDFDVDADATTTFDYIWKPNSAANCVGIPATDGRPDQKPCLNHGLRTVCPSPVAPKTNIFSAPAVGPHRNSQRCPKLYQGRGSPLHRLNQPARPKTNTTQELTCSYFCALPASLGPSFPCPSAPPDLPQQHAWQPPSLRSTAAAINLAGQVL